MIKLPLKIQICRIDLKRASINSEFYLRGDTACCSNAEGVCDIDSKPCDIGTAILTRERKSNDR